jgi:hypothetical protein
MSDELARRIVQAYLSRVMSRSAQRLILCVTCVFFLVRAQRPLVHAKADSSFQPTAAYEWLDIVLETSARDPNDTPHQDVKLFFAVSIAELLWPRIQAYFEGKR